MSPSPRFVPFDLERWQSTWENRVRYNLSESGVHPLSIQELLDLQAAQDPFKPESARNEMKDEFGDRVSIAVIPNASHALIPEQPKAVVEALTTWIKKPP